MFESLCSNKVTFKNFNELNDLFAVLSSTRTEEVFSILRGAVEPYKELFKEVVCLRNDYYEGSPIHAKLFSHNENDNHGNRLTPTRSNYAITGHKEVKARKLSDEDGLAGNLSRYYLDTESLSGRSDSGSIRPRNKSIRPDIKLIS